MATDYNLRNIRTLLTEGFTDEDLRRLCYDVADFRPVYDQLARSSGKAEIIDRLLEYADQNLQIDNLLCLAEKHNPARYEKHQPYYNSVITSSSKPKPLEPERQKRPVLSVVIAVIGVFAACVATIIGPLFVRWFYPSPIPPTNTLLTPVAILLTDTPVPSYIIPPTNTPLLPTNMPTLMNKPINTPLPTNTPIVTVRPFTVADAERVPLNSDCSYNVPDYFLVWEESSKYGRPDEMVTWDLTQFPQGIVIGDAVEAEIDGNGLGNPGKDVLFILESTNPVNRRILRLKSGNFFIVRPEDAEGVLRLRQRHLECKWGDWRDITHYPEWIVPPPDDIHKRVEFKRCDQHPNDGFPEFDDRAGYIPLKLSSAKVVDGKLAWCFQIRFATPLDEWRQYIKEIDPVYQNKEPDGIAVYFPINQPQPPNLKVIVNDSLELGLPPDGVAFQSPCTIRVLLPLETKQEPIVTTAPYEVNASYILKCP